MAGGLLWIKVFGGEPMVVMILGLAVFGLFVFSLLSSYLSERRRS
jgi:hypothetical protein